jgi:hypothetical protein
VPESEDRPLGNSAESPDPDQPLLDDAQESTRIRELEDENKQLQSRIGDLARRIGEEKAQQEREYGDYFKRLTAWYDEHINGLKDTIAKLERKLIEVSDEDGAKAVLAARQEREAEENRAAQNRRAQEEAERQALEQALAEASAALGVEVDELRKTARSPQDAWRVAGQISKTRQEQTLQEMVTQKLAEAGINRVPDREEEVPDQEAASRVPSPSRASESAPRRSRRENDAVLTELNSLEERYQKARKTQKLSQAVALRGQIEAFKREHNL